MLIRVNMEDLREQTHTRHYELYRRCKLEEMGFKDTDPDSKPFRYRSCQVRPAWPSSENLALDNQQGRRDVGVSWRGGAKSPVSVLLDYSLSVFAHLPEKLPPRLEKQGRAGVQRTLC